MAEYIQEENTKTNKAKKILTVVLNVLFYIFIIILLVFAIANLAGRDKKVPNLFGTYMLAVSSSSMDGNKEDSFKFGDLVFAKVASEKDKDNIKVGDIITFIDYSLDPSTNQFNTHRVVDVKVNSEGNKYFILQGDIIEVLYPTAVYNAETYDTDQYMQSKCQVAGLNQVQAVYTGVWKGAGKALTYLQSPKGFGLIIVLPTAILLLLEGTFLVLNIINVNKQKMEMQLQAKDEEQKAMLEAEKEKMRQELLAEMSKEKEEEKETEAKEE